MTGGQDADASVAGAGATGVAAFTRARLEAVFLLLVTFLTDAFFAAVRGFGIVAALAERAAAARLAALFTLAQRAFWAAAMRARPAALMVRRFRGALPLAPKPK